MSTGPVALRTRAIVGGVAGVLAFVVDMFASGLRVVANPGVAERVTSGGVVAMIVFLPVWFAIGALAGMATAIHPPIARNLVVGTLLGATGWTYLATTWSVTARAGAGGAATDNIVVTVAIGAALGALAGLFLWVTHRLRHLRSG